MQPIRSGEDQMKRVIKPEGQFNIAIEEVPVPEPGPGEVRIKAVRSLISRGSEIGARYTREHAVSPDIMGYSLAGVIDALGEGVDCWCVGDRVAALAPHAEYVVCPAVLSSPEQQPCVVALLPGIEFDAAPFWPLVSGAVAWVDIEEIEPNHTVVILGQGLVGSLMLQVAKHNGRGRIVAVDVVASRCALADELGAPLVAIPWADRETALGDAGLLINSTTLGMQGQPSLNLRLDDLPRTAVVNDIVYAPLFTKLLEAAEARGNAIVDGLEMLLHQARPGFHAWYGREPEVTDALRGFVGEDLL